MPRGIPNKPRARYKKMGRKELFQEKIKVCSTIPLEELNCNRVNEELEKYGLLGAGSNSVACTIINKIKQGERSIVNPIGDADLEVAISAVRFAVKRCGGFENLKRAMDIITQVKGI